MGCHYVILGCPPSLRPLPPPGSSLNWSKRARSYGSATTPNGACCVEQKAEVGSRPGGAMRFEWGPAAVEIGTLLVLDPPHRLSYSWEALEPSPTTITFELTAENDGTRLHLIHTGIGEGEDWDNYYTAISSGWNVHFKNLTAWVETGIGETPGPTGTVKSR